MWRAADLTAITAAVVAVGTVLSGGGFAPDRRIVIGVGLAVMAAAGAVSAAAGLRPSEKLVVAWIGWSALTVVLVGAAPLASKEAVTIWFVTLAVFVGARRASPGVARSALAVLAAGAAVLGVSVIVDWLGPGAGRVGGVLENPNLTVALLVPTAAAAFGASPRGRRFSWWWAGAVIALIAVPATGSRAGLLALVVVAVVLLPSGRWRTVAVAGALLLATAVLTVRFARTPDVLAWHRPAIWSSVVATWAERPLTGVSPSALADAVRPHRPEHPEFVGRRQMVPGYAESTPLAVMVQTGLVGLGLLTAACGVAIRDLRRRTRPLSRPNAAALAGAVTVALFHDLLTADPVLLWWAALAGVAAAASTDAPQPPSGTRDRRWPVWAAAAAWIVLWGVVQPAWARVRFEDAPPTTSTTERWQRAEPWDDAPLRRRVSVLLGEPTWRWRDAAEALATAERAATVHPGSAAVWSDLGRVRTRIATELGDPVSVGAARRAFERSTRLDPWVPWTWLEMARLERATGRVDAARALVSRALAAEPATVRAWLFAARLELDRGRPEAARRAFDTATDLLTRRGDPNLSTYEEQLLAADPAEVAQIESSL